MGKSKGIDVSQWQGNINWYAVKNSKQVDFAILRAGYGREISQKDRQFENYYKGCKANGIPCGCYWYSYALTEADAVREAKTFLEAVKGKTFEYPVFLDVEENSQFRLGKQKVSAIIKAFLEYVEKQGYWVGLYMSTSYLNGYVTDEIKNKYTIWVAQYNSRCTYKGQYGIWQKSSTGKINGINGNVDMNECYVDYPAKIKEKGLNGFEKSSSSAESKPTQPAKKSTEEIAKEVLDGKWGNGTERKAALTEAGYDYAAVQKKVNQLIESSKSSAPTTYIDYTVKRGDTLWDIAQKYLGDGNRYIQIMYASGLTSTKIYPGQKLKVPKK